MQDSKTKQVLKMNATGVFEYNGDRGILNFR